MLLINISFWAIDSLQMSVNDFFGLPLQTAEVLGRHADNDCMHDESILKLKEKFGFKTQTEKVAALEMNASGSRWHPCGRISSRLKGFGDWSRTEPN